jgi:hypothetical protein
VQRPEKPVCKNHVLFSLQEKLSHQIAGGKRKPDDREHNDRREREDAQPVGDFRHSTSSSSHR